MLSVPTRDSLGQLTGRLWVVSDVTREREADRLKSEFISVVSHELRTPLTSILGYTELLLAREFAPAEQREFVKTVYNEANHLSQIVEDMLGISRLEAGTVKLNQWVVSMRQLIGEMTAQLSHHLSARHRMVIHIPNQLPPAYVDRDKVKQILFNLLINAAKYSPRGGEIALSIEEAAELPADHPPGRFLLVTVRDQGIGIAPGRSAADLGALLPRRQHQHAPDRRHRPGPLDHPGAGRAARRAHLGREHPRQRQRLLLHPADGRRYGPRAEDALTVGGKQ